MLLTSKHGYSMCVMDLLWLHWRNEGVNEDWMVLGNLYEILCCVYVACVNDLTAFDFI